MEVTKKLNPGAFGTKRYVAEFGERLVCVRYRRDPKTRRRFTTIEIIVDETRTPFPINGMFSQQFTNPDRNVFVQVFYSETELRAKLKGEGARWIKEKKRWQLTYRTAVSLGLKDRVEEFD